MELSDMPTSTYDEYVTFETAARRKIKGIPQQEKDQYELGFKYVRNQFTEISKLKVQLRQNPNRIHLKERIKEIKKDLDLNISSMKDMLLFSILCI